jgi:hypothetical protein
MKFAGIALKEITPLLADPQDARHLIPGMVNDESPAHVLASTAMRWLNSPGTSAAS